MIGLTIYGASESVRRDKHGTLVVTHASEFCVSLVHEEIGVREGVFSPR